MLPVVDIDIFVKKYQPELFELWKKNFDVQPHPEATPEEKIKVLEEGRKKMAAEYLRLTSEKEKNVEEGNCPTNNQFKLLLK